MQRSYLAAVNLGTGDDNALRHELAVERVPVDVALVPVGIVELSEKYGKFGNVLLLCYDQNPVARRQLGGPVGQHRSVATPQARHHVLAMRERGYLGKRLALYSGIANRERGYKRRVVLRLLPCAHTVLRQPWAYQRKHEYHACHTYRISYCRGQGGRIVGQPERAQRLLRSTERRSVCRSPAHHAHCAVGTYTEKRYDNNRKDCAQGYHAKGKQVEPRAALAERTDEAGAYLQAESIYKKHQAETFGVIEHALVDGKTQVSRKDTCKKHESHAETDTPPFYLAENEAHSSYGTDYNHCLESRLLFKKGIQPLHNRPD